MRQHKTNNSPIAYYIGRKENKDWVLFLHAAFADHNMFNSQTEYFRDKFNILTVDIIGHGNSTDTRRGDSIDKMSIWINEILKKEEIEKVHIVGVSLGAVLAQDFANRFPSEVQSLACFGGYDINNFDKTLQKKNGAAQTLMMLKAVFSIKWFASSNKKISAYSSRARQEFYDMNVKFRKRSFMYLASLNGMVNVNQTPQRNYPLLIGCGEHDDPMAIKAVRQWKEHEPDCQTIIFKNAGHCVNMDVPQEFNLTMEKFWKNASDRQ